MNHCSKTTRRRLGGFTRAVTVVVVQHSEKQLYRAIRNNRNGVGPWRETMEEARAAFVGSPQKGAPGYQRDPRKAKKQRNRARNKRARIARRVNR